ncbi:MAG: hypothetical protein LAT68_16150 [Cyclobacteriaceae bacterium]|nr:hypothetical protein [Cyclobacteriaceae bacterium]
MSNQIWKADKSVYEIVDRLVAEHFPELGFVHEPLTSSQESQIAVVLREKAAKSGGRPLLGKTAKANKHLGALTGVDYKFILEIAGDLWCDLTDREREALIFRLLCGCVVVEDEKSGEIKCSVRGPDVQYYYQELDKYGDWMPRPDEEDDGKSIEGSRDPETLERILGYEHEEA